MTPEAIRARFRGRATVDRAVVRRGVEVRTRGDHDLNPDMPTADDLTAAAVLVPLVARRAGMTVLLTQRTEHLPDHPGQISFPGGRIDPIDADSTAAALRETEEEVGIAPGRVELVGRLDDYAVRTGYLVTPVVGIVRPPFDLRPEPTEVAEIFEVPLSFVLDRENHHRGSRQFNGVERRFFVLPFEERYIWGATAAMLVNLSEVLSGS